MFDALSVIPVSEIDLADQQYKISDPCDDTNHLARSIIEIGLINPVIVRAINHKLAVVAGFNRVNACLDAGIDRIQVRKINEKTDPRQVTDLQCLKVSIADNAFQRNLTTSELIRSVSRLCLYDEPKQISAHSVSLFNTPLNLKIVMDFCAIASLPQTVYPLLHENRLAVKPAIQLTKMCPEHANAFLNLFSRIRVSSSKQLDILMLCHEICAREKTDLITVLSNDDLQKILTQDLLDQGVKGDQVRSFLKQRRYPKIMAAEKKFNDHMKKLSLKNDITINPPRDFEGVFYEAAFRFDSFSAFSQRVDQLGSLGQNPLFRDLLP